MPLIAIAAARRRRGASPARWPGSTRSTGSSSRRPTAPRPSGAAAGDRRRAPGRGRAGARPRCSPPSAGRAGRPRARCQRSTACWPSSRAGPASVLVAQADRAGASSPTGCAARPRGRGRRGLPHRAARRRPATSWPRSTAPTPCVFASGSAVEAWVAARAARGAAGRSSPSAHRPRRAPAGSASMSRRRRVARRRRRRRRRARRRARLTRRGSRSRPRDRAAATGDAVGALVRCGSMPAVPDRRPRRLRRTAALRDLVAETIVRTERPDRPAVRARGRSTEPQPIASLPGVVQHTRDSLRNEVARARRRSACRAVILFGVPARKDAVGSGAFDPDGIVQLALADLRGDVGDDVVLIADLCVDEYTDHGHCGVLDERGDVDNDATLEIYAKAARRPGPRRRPRRRPERDDGRPGRPHPRARSTATGSPTSRSSPTRRSTPAGCTGRSATPSTSRSPAAATARATSRTGATPARRCARSTPTSPRAPTW